jgi:hypothetical protein
VVELLEAAGLAEQAGKRPDLLSGGRQQRVAVARALVTGVEAVLADEPTANLDGETAKRVIALMRPMRDTGASPSPSRRVFRARSARPAASAAWRTAPCVKASPLLGRPPMSRTLLIVARYLTRLWRRRLLIGGLAGR